MRGDLLLELRVALRRRGLLGVAAIVGGLVGMVGVYLPWYEVVARMTGLGGQASAPVAELAGWEAQPWIWLVAAAAGLATYVGARTAVDRPYHRSRELLAAAAIVIAVVTAASAFAPPSPQRFARDTDLQRFQAAEHELPDGITLSYAVRPASGVFVALGSSVVLLGVALALAGRR